MNYDNLCAISFTEGSTCRMEVAYIRGELAIGSWRVISCYSQIQLSQLDFIFL